MFLAIIIVLIGSSEVISKEPTPYRIQSLFLYNFTKHITWNTKKKSNFIIGVSGDSKTFLELQKNLSSRIVWGNKIELVMITSPADIDKCHIVFIAKSSEKKILDLIKKSDASDTLIVTEDNLISDEAAISFIHQKSRLNFKINEDKIEESGLLVSETLLSMGVS
jgi:hypothetical protein